MFIDTSELCDLYAEQVDVVEPIFSSFGGVSNFYGKVTTVKCFESNGLIAEVSINITFPYRLLKFCLL